MRKTSYGSRPGDLTHGMGESANGYDPSSIMTLNSETVGCAMPTAPTARCAGGLQADLSCTRQPKGITLDIREYIDYVANGGKLLC